MGTNYIPSPDADFNNWQNNFITYCNGNLAALGLVAGDLTVALADQTDWKAKYQSHQDAVNAAMSARAAKVTSRTAFIAAIRPIVNKIQARPATTDAQRQALQIGMRDTPRTPIPTPSTQPLAIVDTVVRLQHTVNFRDADRPDRRGKPAGVAGVEIYYALTPAGQPAPTDQSAYRFTAVDTATPYVNDFTAVDAGKTAWYLLRWVNPTGQAGPWSEPVGATVAA